jgi:citronellyl-CoA dehydrogenase
MSERYPQFTDEHQIFRKSVRAFVDQELAPHAEQWEEDGIFPRWVFDKMGELGYLGIRVDEEYGGSGLDWWFTVVLVEELTRARTAGLPMGILVQTDMATPVIAELGTDEQKKEFLAPAVAGKKIAALGVTEPDAGSDVAALRTTAKVDGDDYIINGSKTFITNATRADFVTLAVRTGGPGFQGISFVLFPTDTQGYSVARKLDKLGNLSSDTAELAFEDCRIPRRYLLGEENMGFVYIMQNFQGERLVAALAATAGAQRMIDQAIEYTQERKAFGRPLIGFQVTRHHFADMLTQVAAGRQLAYHCVDLKNRGVECTREIAMAKLFCTETAVAVADRCLQMHGGYGYMNEYEISRAWRDTRLLTIGGGASEVMKEIITKTSGI